MLQLAKNWEGNIKRLGEENILVMLIFYTFTVFDIEQSTNLKETV